MENENYFVSNLETGKLNIFTTKEFYKSLEGRDRKVFAMCLWSNNQQCWVSKSKLKNAGYLGTELKRLGFEYRGTVGEKLSFEEQVNREQERAQHRAENAEHRAQKASEESEQTYQRASDMASAIPFGQPILIGHHSEQRDRRYRDKIHNTFGKSFQLQQKAEYYEQKADTAKYTAEGAKFSNPRYLQNRIKECQKNLRTLERYLNGQFYRNSPAREISEKEKEHYNRRITEENEKLSFFAAKMKVIDPDFSLEKKKQQKQKGLKL